jgi:hypothetical protein
MAADDDKKNRDGGGQVMPLGWKANSMEFFPSMQEQDRVESELSRCLDHCCFTRDEREA